MTKIGNENFIVIQGWMVNELELKGNTLLVYAIIYGFSQAEAQVYSGSLQYLADWTNSTKQGVSNCLKILVEKQLIVKNEKIINGVKFCEYYATKFNGGMQQSLIPIQQSLTGGMQQSLTNNISLNNKDNNIVNNKDIYIEDKRKRFVKPTLEEVSAYIQENCYRVDAQHFIDYYESNGWKVGKNAMKDWKASVRTWHRNGYKLTQPKQPQQQSNRAF